MIFLVPTKVLKKRRTGMDFNFFMIVVWCCHCTAQLVICTVDGIFFSLIALIRRLM